MQRIVLAVILILLTGCFNNSERNPKTSLGDVSIGQQLIDLQQALDQEVIDEEEFTEIRANLIDMSKGCMDPVDAEDSDNDEDSGFTWF